MAHVSRDSNRYYFHLQIANELVEEKARLLYARISKVHQNILRLFAGLTISLGRDSMAPT